MPKSLVKKAAKGWNPKLQKSKPAAPNIPGLVTELSFPDGPRDKQLTVVQQLRYLLNLKYELAVADQIIATGAIPRLVDLAATLGGHVVPTSNTNLESHKSCVCVEALFKSLSYSISWQYGIRRGL